MPRSMSYRSRILAALQAGPLTLREAYAMASNKRSAVSRLSEMRERGEITDALVLPGESSRQDADAVHAKQAGAPD